MTQSAPKLLRMKRHWTWSLVIAALLALHAHGWLHAGHGVGDELTSLSDAPCVACQLSQNGGPSGNTSIAPQFQFAAHALDESLDVEAPRFAHKRSHPIRGPPHSPEHHA
ncbi:MAG: hypothetical protein ACSHXK_15685 [Oceanococcus sp.]